MNRSTLAALLAAATLALSGCTLFAERTFEVTWARMGTPARIVDDTPVRIQIPDGSGGWTPSQADLSGMIALDEPTLEYYQGLDAKAKAK